MACNRAWLVSCEGIVFSVALWLSTCANLTMMFAFPNEYVQKHFILTLTCSAWLCLAYLCLLKLNFFEGKTACDKIRNMVGVVGVSTSVLAALCLVFSTGKYDKAHDPETNSGVNYFCMIEQLLVALLYICIIFFERVQEYLLSLSWFQKSPSDQADPAASVSIAVPENTNDNYKHTVAEAEDDQAAVVEVMDDDAAVPEPRESKLSEDEFVHIPVNENTVKFQGSDNASETQAAADSASEADELIKPPTKEEHAQVGEREVVEERKASDV